MSVLNKIKRNQTLNMIYMDNNGVITKCRVKVFKVIEGSSQAYCYLRGSKRTFRIANVLALVPVVSAERMVI